MDCAERQLTNDGAAIALQPKVFDTLVLLLDRPGRLIGKAEMIQALWPDIFVSESALTKNISDLRKVLEDGGEGAGYIETVPKSGYRFSMPVEVEERAPVAAPPPAVAGPVRLPLSSYRKATLSIIGLAIVATAAGLVVSRRASTAAGAGIRSIAVLPFRPMSAQQRDQYLELGMADTLISKLNAGGNLVVVPTRPVGKFAAESSNGIAAGQALGVDAVLEGSVQRLDNALRVSARLTRVKDGALLWAGAIDGTAANLFLVQDSLAQQVLAALTYKLTPAQRNQIARHATADPEAYQWYQKGRIFAGRRTAEGFENAIRCYQAAISRDARYALAWSGLADAHMLTAWYFTRPTRPAFALAKEAARRAIALDDSLAEAHTSMAVVHENADWSFHEADYEFRRALELNPNYATAHHWYGEFLGLMGRAPEALMHLRRARQLDPLSTIIGADTAKALIDARRYAEAIEECKRTLELDPTFAPARGWLQIAYTWNGMYGEAQAEEDLLDDGTETATNSLGKAVFYALAGQPRKAAGFRERFQQLAKAGHVEPWQMALLYLQVQPDRNKALAWLRKAYDERNPFLMGAKVAPDFDPIRSDPRFEELLQRMNFL